MFNICTIFNLLSFTLLSNGKINQKLQTKFVEICLFTRDVGEYYYVAQGKLSIPNVDDGEECLLTDVSRLLFSAK